MTPQYCLRIPTAHDFVSLAHSNERLHVRNERDFPQAKLDSEINIRFLLNEHGDLYVLLHNKRVRILFNLKKNRKKNYQTEKKI